MFPNSQRMSKANYKIVLSIYKLKSYASQLPRKFLSPISF